MRSAFTGLSRPPTSAAAPAARSTRGGAETQFADERLEAVLVLRTPLVDRAAGAAAEVGGRLNPVNALRTRGSAWTQVELDLLQGMLQAKLSMWRVLEQLAPHLPAVDAAEMRGLCEKTAEQRREVERITSATLEGRFLAG